MPSLNSFLEKIKEGMAVRAAVPLLGATEKERLHCFFGKADHSGFTLFFPYGVLETDRVDTSRPCMVMFDFPNQTISVSADYQCHQGFV